MRKPARATRIAALAVVAVLLLGLGADAGAAATRPTATTAEPGVAAFRGLGTWVDVYDFGPNFQGSPASPPAVTVESVDDMAKLGVKTIYLQASQDDTRSEGTIVDRKLVGAILRRAHRRDVRVVAWYLPHFEDVDRDMRHIRAMHSFRSGGERFDGIGLDLEWTTDVPETARRNRALLQIAARTRRAVTDMPIGAIVLEPVLVEDVNLEYWPNFPWKKMRPFVDVWLPMAYWTNRTDASGWNNGFKYTSENIRRTRKNVGDPDAFVHVIGGIGDQTKVVDTTGFVNAAKRREAIGWSVYDYVTTSSSAWPRLRG